MRRLEAIEEIMNTVTNEIVVSSCGKISREVFSIKDRSKNFYNMGAMGSTLGIGIGLAISLPKQKIVVIIGDGEALMNLENLVMLNYLQKEKNMKNLDLYILDNNIYDSTGGQKTLSKSIDFRLLCFCKVIFCGDSIFDAPRIPLQPCDIKERFMNAIKEK